MDDGPSYRQTEPAETPVNAGSLPWFALSVAAGLAVFGAIFFSIDVGIPPAGASVFPRAEVFMDISGGGEIGGGLLGEQAALFDTEPLFLPTRWNAGRAREVFELSGGDPLPPFMPYDPQIALDAQRWLSVEGEPSSALLTAQELLSPRHTNFFSQFGRERAAETLPPRTALIQIRKGGELVDEVAVRNLPDSVLNERLWSPVDFMMLVGADAVFAGEPLLWGSSGSEATDEALRALLGRYLKAGRLGQGHFRVSVMP